MDAGLLSLEVIISSPRKVILDGSMRLLTICLAEVGTLANLPGFANRDAKQISVKSIKRGLLATHQAASVSWSNKLNMTLQSLSEHIAEY